ncbi:PREDICTED: uncharacterized protein LOC104605761 [Nelumbo nucifera]|uniref:Uncharacterized protein LOC104605761 n=1 Tax=Nelumbo nucifera TaxID=4432 RepID=A0A1U8AZJ5_NELNU|nr:PREDICTED: uncharacterized protein LOC104605761 [Nelumbo nucifera]
MAYYGKLKVMWDELADYDPIPTCRCSGCNCKIATMLEKKREEERVHQFLMGLDDTTYGTVHSNILSIELLSSLNRVYAIVIQEKRHQSIAKSKEERSDAVGFAVHVGADAKAVAARTKDKNVSCAHCGKSEHEAKDYFQVTGYPEWWGDRHAQPGKKQVAGEVVRAWVPVDKDEETRQENAAQAAGSETGGQKVGTTNDHDRSGFLGLSGDQWTTLLNILNSHKSERLSGKKIPTDCIIDSGESHHMTGEINLLIDVRNITPCLMELPNGKQITAVKEGTLHLGGNIAKQTRKCFPESKHKADDCFSLIYCDTWGAYEVPASCGAIYFLTIVDDYSRAVWVYLLLEKSEVAHIIENFCAMVERQFGKQVRAVQSDNGIEFKGLKSYFKTHGILHQTFCVGTPQQNGRVERKHRTPSSVLGGKTLYEVLFGTTPQFEQIRVFGCLFYAHWSPRDKDKFGARSRKCVFVGYPYEKKGWRVYNVESIEYLISRDVVFHENIFPYTSDLEETLEDNPSLEIAAVVDDDVFHSHRGHKDKGSVEDNICANDRESFQDTHRGEEEQGNGGGVQEVEANDGEDGISMAPAPQTAPEEQLGKGHRHRTLSVLLKPYETYTTRCLKDPTHTQANSESKSLGTTPYPVANYVTCTNFFAKHQAFLAAVTTGAEPTSFFEVVKSEKWREKL